MASEALGRKVLIVWVRVVDLRCVVRLVLFNICMSRLLKLIRLRELCISRLLMLLATRLMTLLIVEVIMGWFPQRVLAMAKLNFLVRDPRVMIVVRCRRVPIKTVPLLMLLTGRYIRSMWWWVLIGRLRYVVAILCSIRVFLGLLAMVVIDGLVSIRRVLAALSVCLMKLATILVTLPSGL